MARPQKTAFSAWLRGGQTLGHTFDMTVEVLARLVIMSALWGLACLHAVNHYSSEKEQLYGMAALEADILDWIGPPAPQRLSVKHPSGRDLSYPVEIVSKLSWMRPYSDAYRTRFRHGLVFFLIGVVVLGMGSAVWFLEFGREKTKSRQVRGQRVDRVSNVVLEVEQFNASEARRRGIRNHQPARLIGVPFPFETEQEHTLIVGSPGSGKSRAIHDLIESIRARGDRAIIYDAELDFIRTWFDPAGDVILNPFDARSPAWSPYFDAVELPDFEKLAHSLYKSSRTGDPYWTDVARQLFSWTAYVLRQRDPDVRLEDLLRVLFGPTDRLASVLLGTPAHKHVKDGPGPRVGSLESVLVEGVTPLVYLLGGEGRFSIRDWVNAPSGVGGFLFLSAPETHIDSLRPLIGFWSELVVGSLLARHETTRQPTWLILDEFASLGRIDKLADGPQRLRKYGGAIVLGLQQVSQVQEIYGAERARTIMGQCATKLILRAQDPETARFMSEQLGRRLVRRMDESTSYGANSIRDGVGLSPKEELEPVALPEDILNLPKFHGYIRLSNARPEIAFPIAPVKFSFGDRRQIAKGFEPVSGPDPVQLFLAAVRGEPLKPAGLEDDQGAAANASEPLQPTSGGLWSDEQVQTADGHLSRGGRKQRHSTRTRPPPARQAPPQPSLFDDESTGTALPKPPAGRQPDGGLGLDFTMPEG